MVVVFVLLIIIIILFSLDKFPPDTIVLLSLIALVVSGVITPSQAFEGFGSDFIIMLSSIFIISASLQHNGVVEYLSNKLINNHPRNYFFTIVIIMLGVGILSAFMNNTSVAAVMVLPILGMARKTNQPASRYLMPMAFASLLGGTCTLIGTSTNIAGSNFLVENGYQPIGMFEFLPIGILSLVICTLFFAFLGKKILPDRSGSQDQENQQSRLFYAYFKVENSSSLVGKTILSLNAANITLIKVETDEGIVHQQPDYKIATGDNLYIKATSEELQVFHKKYGSHGDRDNVITYEPHIAEIMVLPSSFINNLTINDSNFLQRTGLMTIGLFRKGHHFSTEINDTTIKTGDILIVEGTSADLEQVRQNNNFIVLSQDMKSKLPDLKKGFISLGIFAAAALAGALGLLPLSISFLSAVLLSMSFKVLPADIVYSKVNWRLVILIGGMTAFGTAIKQTGGDLFLANQITAIFSGTSTIVILFAFMLLTVLLTQPISNAAAALVILPIATQAAINLNSNPRSFAIAIILSASISMITPFEPASLLVLGPGRYKILDFFKIGGILTIVGLLIILVMVNLLYDL